MKFTVKLADPETEKLRMLALQSNQPLVQTLYQLIQRELAKTPKPSRHVNKYAHFSKAPPQPDAA